MSQADHEQHEKERDAREKALEGIAKDSGKPKHGTHGGKRAGAGRKRAPRLCVLLTWVDFRWAVAGRFSLDGCYKSKFLSVRLCAV